MSNELTNILVPAITALLSGGLVAIIMAISNMKHANKQNAREDKKLKLEEANSLIDNYKNLLVTYNERFRIMSERLDLTENKYNSAKEAIDKYQAKIDELTRELVRQACVIEALQNKVAEAEDIAATYLERIKKLESELSVYQGGK